MIKHIDKVEGTLAYWDITCPAATKIETHQFINRSGARVVTSNKDGLLDRKTFKQGEPIGILLPIGDWVFESAGADLKYKKQTTLSSQGPGTYINLVLDGFTPFSVRFGRYTKVVAAPKK